MYSVVLMVALTSGGDVPAFGGCRGGCYGCYGCCGCYGGCYGGRRHGCCGCYGGCYGCHGCCGCHGGCFGGRRHGCCGCHGGCYGCHGCHGCCGCHGGCFGCVGGTVAPPLAPAAPAPAAPKKTSFEGAAPATLIVSVPADARLSIDGEETTSTAKERVFVSPALEFGREYHYTLQAEFQKNGKTVICSKEVAVKAGEETRVTVDADNSTEIASR